MKIKYRKFVTCEKTNYKKRKNDLRGECLCGLYLHCCRLYLPLLHLSLQKWEYTLVMAFVFLHEQFTPKSIIGCVLIGIGNLVMVL